MSVAGKCLTALRLKTRELSDSIEIQNKASCTTERGDQQHTPGSNCNSSKGGSGADRICGAGFNSLTWTASRSAMDLNHLKHHPIPGGGKIPHPRHWHSH